MGSTVTTTDPYQVLGVSKDATATAIRSAYRKLVLQTHPDKVQDESLRAAKQDEFQRIQQAYEILSDEAKRRQYDEQVKFAQHKRDLYAEVERGGSGERFEVRTAAPSREFDRRYEEQRRARRSFEDDQFPIYDEFPARKHDGYDIRRSPRTYDDRKVGRDLDDEKERIRNGRQTERELQSERRRVRERELRQRRAEKSSRIESFDDDEENRIRNIIDPEERPRRRSGDTRRREEWSTSDDSISREPLRRRETSNVYDTARKISSAKDYILDVSERHAPRVQRSTTSGFYEVTASTIPIGESTVRRSSARRSSDRDRTRGGSGHSKPSRREPTRESPIEIVEPNAAYETRSRVIPNMPTANSSPANLRTPSTPRPTPPHQHRSATMQTPRESYQETPSLSRSSTMPAAHASSSSSRRRDPVTPGSSKLKTSRMAEVDSGYSSPSTPDAPWMSSTPSATRPGEYIVIEDVEPRYTTSFGRHRRVLVESDDEDDDRHERSVSPHTRGRSSEHTARPSLPHERPANARTVSYAYPREPSSRPTMAESPSYRKESSSSAAAATRGSPALLRTGTSTAHHSSSRRLYGEVAYTPREVHYSPRIGPEHVLYTDSRRSSGGGTETIYRDAAPHSSRSHFVYGPHHLMRAQTST